MRPLAARARYSHPKKLAPRALVMAAAEDAQAQTICELWGGGASARDFRLTVPDASVVSCETDEQLWPAMMLDAQQNGYAYHLGDIKKVRGKFDLIWLDLCCQWCGTARDLVSNASKKLNPDGTLAVTLMAARENPEIAADRLFMVPKSIERATGLRTTLLYPYQTKSPMWLLLFRGSASWSWWMDVPDRVLRIKGRNPDDWVWSRGNRLDPDGSAFDIVQEAIAEDGFWVSDWAVDYRPGKLLALLFPEVHRRRVMPQEVAS